jgi:predicted Fe-S protein YdhL (DUF1289 family)
MDPGSGLCKGCLRTLAEIAGWSGMTDAERERALEIVAERKRKLNIPEVPIPPVT